MSAPCRPVTGRFLFSLLLVKKRKSLVSLCFFWGGDLPLVTKGKEKKKERKKQPTPGKACNQLRLRYCFTWVG